MSDFKTPRSRTPSSKTPGDSHRPGPQPALDALLANSAGDPIRRAMWLDTLDLRLRPHLPPSLAAHARLANVDGTKLVFVVDSPVWHARLRLASSDLVEAARSVGLDVSELVVKTTTQLRPDTRVQPTATTASLVPASARDALQAALASLRDPQDGSGNDMS